MTQLKDKIQDALDESRMLVLGAQVLIGFEFSSNFQEGFARLPATLRSANTAALALMLIVLTLLIAPCAYHQLAAQGEDRLDLLRFSTRVMDVALFPFALGLGITVYIPAEQIAGAAAGIGFAAATIILAGAFWYGPAILRTPKESEKMEETGRTSIHDKIRQALTEARVIIPGNQALLGFQFTVILQRSFTDLPLWIKYVHLASLALIMVSTILLMTPAAFHRIAEHGEETERFYRVTHLLVLCSLPPLALGMCGDFFIVLFKITDSLATSLVAGGLMLCLFIGMWFGYTSWRRNRNSSGLLAWQEEM
ncbi:MAG: putative rane protein [Bryobacterales bacterium]|nr:putative rane protein [Bryobacterales bacterium]